MTHDLIALSALIEEIAPDTVRDDRLVAFHYMERIKQIATDEIDRQSRTVIDAEYEVTYFD